jgi:antirestriction protein ArdC
MEEIKANNRNKPLVPFVTKLIQNLEKGYLIWEKGFESTAPLVMYNAVTKKQYQGINTLILGLHSEENNYADPRWMTFNQMRDNGFSFNQPAKGKGVNIVFFEVYDKNTKKRFDQKTIAHLSVNDQKEYINENTYYFGKSSTVFNGSLIKGLDKLETKDFSEIIENRNQKMEDIISRSEAKIIHGAVRVPYYRPSTDHIGMPYAAQYKDITHYYSTALHEIAHSTGHPKRLNRNLRFRRASKEYAIEELRAEIASGIMGIQYGLPLTEEHIKNHSAYIQSWLTNVKNEPDILFNAIRDATKIEKYISDKMGYDDSKKSSLTDEEIKEIISSFDKQQTNTEQATDENISKDAQALKSGQNDALDTKSIEYSNIETTSHKTALNDRTEASDDVESINTIDKLKKIRQARASQYEFASYSLFSNTNEDEDYNSHDKNTVSVKKQGICK